MRFVSLSLWVKSCWNEIGYQYQISQTVSPIEISITKLSSKINPKNKLCFVPWWNDKQFRFAGNTRRDVRFTKKFIKFCNLVSIILTVLLISKVSLYVGSRLILYFLKPIRSSSQSTLLMTSYCLYNIFSTNLEFWYLFSNWISYFYTWRSCCFLISWISLGLVWLVSVLKLMWHMLVSHFRDYLPSWTRRL